MLLSKKLVPRGGAGQNSIVLASKVLVVHSRRGLILRRSSGDRTAPGMWEFPGGKMEPGEAPEQAALRETEEETGLSITLRRVMYASTSFTSPRRQIVVFSYLAGCENGNVHLSAEHSDYRWVTKSQMREMLGRPILRRLEKYNVFSMDDVLIDD